MTSNSQQTIRRSRSLVAASYTNDRQGQRQYNTPNRNNNDRRETTRNRPGLDELY